jgi:GT2 family glycosyltransferase
MLPDHSPPVAIIVLNWNRKDDTLRCLASLERATYPAASVIVVDNASTDGSVEAIRAAFPAARNIENATNLGYAGGNNAGLQAALADGFPFVLVLNNDTVLHPEAVERLVACATSHPGAGIVAPAICYLDHPERVWSAGGTIDWSAGVVSSTYVDQPSGQLPGHPYTVDHVTGCCMLLRAEAVRTSGMIDPRFFLYFEETEWCVRIARHGYEIVVEPAARIWHDIQPAEQEGSPAIAYYMTRNQLLFLNAAQAPLSTRLRAAGRQVRTIASLFVRPHSPARARGRASMLRAMRDHVLRRYGPAPSMR